MLLTRQSLLSRPYRYLYLLYDFIHRRGFELGLSGVKLPFDYMGNPYKFYTPEMFSTSHDVHDAISWMKTTDIFFKHKDDIYPLEAINTPDDYDNNYISDIKHLLVGLAILAKLHTKKENISKQDVLSMDRYISSRQANVSRDNLIDINISLSDSAINVVSSSIFQPLIKDDIRYACDFVNSKNVSDNLDTLINSDKYKIKLVVGSNRGIAKNDIKLFESVKGNLKEIKLENRAK